MADRAVTLPLHIGIAKDLQQVLDVKTLALRAEHHKIDDQQLVRPVIGCLNHRVIILVQLKTERGQVDQDLFKSDMVSA